MVFATFWYFKRSCGFLAVSSGFQVGLHLGIDLGFGLRVSLGFHLGLSAFQRFIEGFIYLQV